MIVYQCGISWNLRKTLSVRVVTSFSINYAFPLNLSIDLHVVYVFCAMCGVIYTSTCHLVEQPLGKCYQPTLSRTHHDWTALLDSLLAATVVLSGCQTLTGHIQMLCPYKSQVVLRKTGSYWHHSAKPEYTGLGVFNFDSLRHLVLMHAIATAVDKGKT